MWFTGSLSLLTFLITYWRPTLPLLCCSGTIVLGISIYPCLEIYAVIEADKDEKAIEMESAGQPFNFLHVNWWFWIMEWIVLMGISLLPVCHTWSRLTVWEHLRDGMDVDGSLKRQ